MVIELKATIQNGLTNPAVIGNGGGDDILKKQNQNNIKDLSTAKGNFPEVTFCNISDKNSSSFDTLCEQIKNGKARKRLISSNDGESADSIDSSTDKKKPEIPDGGYGWVVVFASLCISLVADGISFSFGLIYNELLMYFQESKSKTAWIGSLFLAVPLLVGPIMSNLVDKYGCRKMTIIGGLLSSTGFALASISQSIEMLYLTFGIISGLGLGIGYVTAVVSIAFWFDKNRTFATGIGASGTGIGTFLYAPFTQWLLETFGWRGATLILAGTLLNTCVFGCLLRDPGWLIEENRLESRSQSVTTFSNSSVCLDEIKKLLENGATKEAVLDTLVTNYNTEANQQILDPADNRAAKKYNSEIFLPTFLSSTENNSSCNYLRQESRRSLRRKDDVEILSKENLLSLSSPDKSRYLASVETLSPSEKVSSTMPNTPMRSSIGSIHSSDETYTSDNKKNHLNGSRLSLNENNLNRPPDPILEEFRNSYRGNSLDVVFEGQPLVPNDNCNGDVKIPIDSDGREIFSAQGREKRKRHDTHNNFDSNDRATLRRNLAMPNSNFLKYMRVHRNSIHYRGALLNTHRYRLRASSCPNIFRNSMTTIARENEETWYDSFVDIMKSIFDFSLFLDMKFLLFNLSTLLLFIWFIIPYFYITQYMLKYDYNEEQSAMLISIIGIFNTIGMIGLGFVGDQPWLNVTKTYAICLVFCGLSIGLMPPVITHYWALVILCTIFGITFASSFSFTPSILVTIVDLDDFTCAYGLVLLVQGIGNLIGPPLAGVIYDLTLRWDDSFYAAGFFISLSGVLAYLVAVIEDRDKRKAKELENQNN